MRVSLYSGALCGFLSAAGAVAQGLQPPNWDKDIRLAETIDVNPDPRIVEINLVARVAPVEIAPGRRVEAWTYDGMMPGPLIRARVGDRLIVHFTNQLPSPTTVHWHGLRIPIQMDGVPGHSQAEVQTGQSFTYDFVVPDAGLFWYHPHVMSAAQVGFGLYGALLVEDPNDGVIADQLVIVLSDIGLEEDGRTLESPESGGSAGMAFGREGNHLLVNGRQDRRLLARSGAPQRWRVVNAAKSRYFEIDLGAGQPFTQIGSDGGLQEYPVASDTLVLGPGERADVIVVPSAPPGGQVVVRSLLRNRGYGSVEARLPFEDLFSIVMADLPAVASGVLPRVTRTIQPLSAAGATPVALELTIDQDARGAFAYSIRANGATLSHAKPLPARLGETQLWTLTNKTKWSHPFHLHGFFFQVLDDKGEPVHPLAWKDTVDVPFEKSARVIVRFDERPGMWMIHCHILDHADGGLMGMVDLR